MTNSLSPSRKQMTYESFVDCESSTIPGVRYRIARMSFARRLDLTRRVRDLLARLEFLEAGNGARDQIEASLLKQQVDEVYLEWGLLDLSGLRVDGRDATPQDAVRCGPESLAHEVLSRIKTETGLSEAERKN